MHIRNLVALLLVLAAAGAFCSAPARAQDVYAQRQAQELDRNVLCSLRDNLRCVYTARNPQVLAVNSQIAALDKRLKRLPKPYPNSQDVIRHSRIWLLSKPAQKRS